MGSRQRSETLAQEDSEMTSLRIVKPQHEAPSYDDDFFDDILGLFPDASGYAPKSGCCGKYIYDGRNWNDVIEDSIDYYAPRGDHDLIQQAVADAAQWNMPAETPYIDLGVGG